MWKTNGISHNISYTSFVWRGKRLSEQERKACEMLFNGFTREEIEDELVITRGHLATVFTHARRKGVPIPREPSRARTGPGAPRFTTEHLRKLKVQLGSPTLLADRVGLTYGAVWRRLRYAA